MRFEKWLKENILETGEHYKGETIVAKYLPVFGLGEWAWENFNDRGRKISEGHFATARDVGIPKFKGTVYDWHKQRNNIYFNVAVACLGKKEIRRRLEKAV